MFPINHSAIYTNLIILVLPATIEQHVKSLANMIGKSKRENNKKNRLPSEFFLYRVVSATESSLWLAFRCRLPLVPPVPEAIKNLIAVEHKPGFDCF